VGWNAATASAEHLAAAGARALASFGMAGGLDPNLRAGTLLLPLAIVTVEGATFPCASEWRMRLIAACRAAQLSSGTLVTSRAPVASVVAKAALHRSSGAAAVDMESAAVAQVAARGRLPFVALRAIVDEAAAAVPQAVLSSADAAGEVALARLLPALARRPQDLSALLKLGAGYRHACRTLRAVARSGALGSPPPHGVQPA
jgi:adenosylhomocysteine nucleosidase